MKALLLLLVLHAATLTWGQKKITLSFEQAPLEKVCKEIGRQSGYSFIYTREQLRQSKPVTIHVEEVPLEKVLELCFRDQPLAYQVNDRYIVLRVKEGNSLAPAGSVIRGRVTDDSDVPLAGATVQVPQKKVYGISDASGIFQLSGLAEGDRVLISCVGYVGTEVTLTSEQPLHIRLAPAVNQLDEAMVIAYGNTSRRFTTASISRMNATEISRQPVRHVLGAMEARLPGVFISPASGLPGANFNILIRGQQSLKQGSQPLYIIDGVPFMLNSGTLAQVTVMDINHPLNSINPADIESIEILKDADAISIYGSQGANGVVLITTKKGRPGTVTLALHQSVSLGKVSHRQKLLNTGQYLAMRKEAFRNDGTTPDVSTAPDLILWDTAAYTDWQEQLIGGTARTTSTQLSLSGGSVQTQFLVGGSYLAETTVFPDADAAAKGNLRLRLDYRSRDSRVKLGISAAYGFDRKYLPVNDLTSMIYLPPNTPAAHDSAGRHTWNQWPSGVDNPYARLENSYRSLAGNLVSSMHLQLAITAKLQLQIVTGYNQLFLEETMLNPIRAQRPSAATTGSHRLGNSRLQSFTVEPQLRYTLLGWGGRIELLAGGSFQHRRQKGSIVTATGYTSDDLLPALSAAGQVTASSSYSEYKYLGLFGRASYAAKNRYLLNINLRRDGSSRFGPADRFALFGSIGAGWVFSEEGWVKQSLPWLSFGKLRGSIGVSGNDQIGDYQYLDTWSSTSTNVYQGVTGLLPSRLYNPSFRWERNRKLEAALELAFLKDRLQFSIAWFRNLSDNQLVNYRLPALTGFSTVLKNLDAAILNTGWEMSLSAALVSQKKVGWTASANLTIPRSKLLRYPGLEYSTDRFNYVVGKPLTLVQVYQSLGVDPGSGRYMFEDISKNGVISSPDDYAGTRFVGQHWYGGLESELKLGNWEFSLFWQCVRQTGKHFAASYFTVPGQLGNQPVSVMDRWQQPGDQSSVQAFTAGSAAATQSYYNYQSSSAIIADASFLRLKNLSLAYSVATGKLKRYHIENFRLYVQGQNLLTISGYRDADPTTQNINALPTLKMIVAGIQLTIK